MGKKAKETAALLVELKHGDRVRLTEAAIRKAHALGHHNNWQGLERASIVEQQNQTGVVSALIECDEGGACVVAWSNRAFYLPTYAFELAETE